jgi:hypothetical protein
MRHYLMTTDEHFDAAVNGEEPVAEAAAQDPSDEAAQNAAQSAHAGVRGESHEQSSAHEKPRQMPGLASSSEMPQLLGLAGSALLSSALKNPGY